jgi:hypothetical protein
MVAKLLLLITKIEVILFIQLQNTITDGTDPENCLLPPALNNEIFDIRFSTGKFAEDVSTGIHPIELKGIPGLSFRMKQVIY